MVGCPLRVAIWAERSLTRYASSADRVRFRGQGSAASVIGKHIVVSGRGILPSMDGAALHGASGSDTCWRPMVSKKSKTLPHQIASRNRS